MALLKNKLVLIIIAVLLLGGGGAYYFLVLGKPSEASAKHRGHGDKDAHAEEDEHEDEDAHASEEEEEEEEEEEYDGGHGGHGGAKDPVIEPFVVNLADPGSRRYLRVSLKFKLRKREESEPLLVARMPQVRDAVLMLLSGKTTDQLSTVEGKTLLRSELIDRLNSVLKKRGLKKAIKNLYFTEFLIQ